MKVRSKRYWFGLLMVLGGAFSLLLAGVTAAEQAVSGQWMLGLPGFADLQVGSGPTTVLVGIAAVFLLLLGAGLHSKRSDFRIGN